jgi:hypothetical protein
MLYGAIKKEYAVRAEAYKNLEGHPDRDKDYHLHSGVIADLIREYQTAGGKRDVERYR